MQGQTENKHIYRIGNINFVVTPVYKKDSNETIFSILLKLMQAELAHN